MRKIHSLRHNIKRSIDWYGKKYMFYRPYKDQYNEPQEIVPPVQTVKGIYHASSRSFVQLVASEGATIKSKANKGILCANDETLNIQQGDTVFVHNGDFKVTAVEPVLYGDEAIAQEISIEEVVKGTD